MVTAKLFVPCVTPEREKEREIQRERERINIAVYVKTSVAGMLPL